jgi:hypothetical protein
MAPDTPTLIIGAQAAITSTATGLDDHQDARTKNISTGLYGLTGYVRDLAQYRVHL